MPANARCPSCGARLNLKGTAPGRRYRCPRCSAEVQAPHAAAPTAARTPQAARGMTLSRPVLAAVATSFVVVLAVCGGVSFFLGRLSVGAPGVAGVAPALAAKAKAAEEADEPVPPPTSDPPYQGVPASAWARMLEDADPATSSAAGANLVRIGDPAIPHVERVYRDGDLLARNAAGSVLILMTQQGSGAALDALVRAARSHDKVTRAIALVNLGSAGPNARPAIPVLEKIAASDPEPSLRDAAKEDIGKIKRAR